jgi:hypothetical protein
MLRALANVIGIQSVGIEANSRRVGPVVSQFDSLDRLVFPGSRKHPPMPRERTAPNVGINNRSAEKCKQLNGE